MTLAIMQPYFFPYLGYFQLMREADTFVFYDDVSYIKGGWINRNSILSLNGPTRITLQVTGASSNKKINQVGVGANRLALIKTIAQAYAKAPYAAEIMVLIERCLTHEGDNLAEFLAFTLEQTARFIGLETRFITSSSLDIDPALSGPDRVLAVCHALDAARYINPIGGAQLYDKAAFGDAGLELGFLQPRLSPYPQYRRTGDFVPSLSIIDALMFLGPGGLAAQLASYDIV